jgi:hypothetical protein
VIFDSTVLRMDIASMIALYRIKKNVTQLKMVEIQQLTSFIWMVIVVGNLGRDIGPVKISFAIVLLLILTVENKSAPRWTRSMMDAHPVVRRVQQCQSHINVNLN